MYDKLKLVLRLTIGMGILLALCWTLDVNAVAANLVALDMAWFVWLCLLAILIKVLKAFKWWLLLRARDLPISAWQTTRLYFVGNLVGALTPAGLGSDVYRTVALSDFQQSNDVISTLMVERLIGFAVLAMAAVICIPFSAEFLDPVVLSVWWKVVLAGLLLICVFAGLLSSGLFDHWIKGVPSRFNIIDEVRKLLSAFYSFRAHKGLLGLFTVLTGIEILILVLISYTAAWALRIDVPFLYFLAVVPLIQFLIRLPISIQVLGIQEGLYVYMFLAAGFPKSDGLSVSFLLRIVEILLIFLPGLAMMISRSRFKSTQRESE